MNRPPYRPIDPADPPAACCAELESSLGNHAINPTPARLTWRDVETHPDFWYPGANGQPGYYLIVRTYDEQSDREIGTYTRMDYCPFCDSTMDAGPRR